MKSSSAGPDFVRMSRFSAAMEACAALDQLGDDGRIGLDAGRARRRPAPDLGPRPGGRDEVVAFEDGLQRVPDQRIGSPHDLQEAGAARGRRQVAG